MKEESMATRLQRAKMTRESPTHSATNDKLLNLAKQHIREAPRLAERRDKAMARVKRSPRHSTGSPKKSEQFNFDEKDATVPTSPGKQLGRLGRALAKAKEKDQGVSPSPSPAPRLGSVSPKPRKESRQPATFRQNTSEYRQPPSSKDRARSPNPRPINSEMRDGPPAVQLHANTSRPVSPKPSYAAAPSPKLSFAEKQAQFGGNTTVKSPPVVNSSKSRSFSPKPAVPRFRSMSPPNPKSESKAKQNRPQPISTSPTPQYSFRFGAAANKEPKPVIYNVPSSGYMSPTKSSRAKLNDKVVVVEEEKDLIIEEKNKGIIETPEKVSVSSMKAMFNRGKSPVRPVIPRFKSPLKIPSLQPATSNDESIQTMPVKQEIVSVPSDEGESVKTEPAIAVTKAKVYKSSKPSTMSFSPSWVKKMSPVVEGNNTEKDEGMKTHVPPKSLRHDKDIEPIKEENETNDPLPTSNPPIDSPTGGMEGSESEEQKKPMFEVSKSAIIAFPTKKPRRSTSRKSITEEEVSSVQITTESSPKQQDVPPKESFKNTEFRSQQQSVPPKESFKNRPTWKNTIETPDKISVSSMTNRFGVRSTTPTRSKEAPASRFRMEPAHISQSPRRSRQTWINSDDDDIGSEVKPKIEKDTVLSGRPTWKSKVAAVVDEERSKLTVSTEPEVSAKPTSPTKANTKNQNQTCPFSVPKPIDPDELTGLLNKRRYFEKEDESTQAIKKEKPAISSLTVNIDSKENEETKSTVNVEAGFMEPNAVKKVDPPSDESSSAPPKSPIKSPRQRTEKPWNKDLNTLSPASWQRRDRSQSPPKRMNKPNNRLSELALSVNEIEFSDVKKQNRKHQLPISPDSMGALNPPSFDNSPTKFSDVFFETKNPFRQKEFKAEEPAEVKKSDKKKSVEKQRMSGAAAVLQFWTNSSSDDESEESDNWKADEVSESGGIQAKQLVLSPDSTASKARKSLDPFSPNVEKLLDQAGVYADSQTFDSVWNEDEPMSDFGMDPLALSNGFEATFQSKGLGFSPKNRKKSSQNLISLNDCGTWSFDKEASFDSDACKKGVSNPQEI